jgi:hypothetical protein
MRPVPIPLAWLFLVLAAINVANAIQSMRSPTGPEWIDWASIGLSTLMVTVGTGSLLAHRRRKRASRRDASP